MRADTQPPAPPNVTADRATLPPSGLISAGWKDILQRVWRGISEDHVVAIAAGVAFYSILAIFPAIAALVALYGLFADPATMGEHLKASQACCREAPSKSSRTNSVGSWRSPARRWASPSSLGLSCRFGAQTAA
jgi:hypothetical protein